VIDLTGDVLYLSFPSQRDVDSFKQPAAGDTVSEILRQAIVDVLGLRVKFVARVAGARSEATPDTQGRVAAPATDNDASTGQASWATAIVPTDDPGPIEDPGPITDDTAPSDDIQPAADAGTSPDDIDVAGQDMPLDRDAPPADPQKDSEARAPTSRLVSPKPDLDKRRYGESVVREILGAKFIEEFAVAPRVTPRDG
jgi:DNA polymerase-3 subunit gamma/tau